MLDVQEGVLLGPLTTFQIGGPAKYFVDVRTEDEIRDALQWAKERGVKHVVLSGGSNVLISDGGLDALVIHVAEGGFAFEGATLTAQSGCNLLKMIRAASDRNLGGWEKLAGIPGTIGGAVRGNAGAFGTEIKDVATRVRALNAETGEACDFSNADCDFSYRHSFFKARPEWIITEVAVSLAPARADESKRRCDETIQERERRHLQNVRAAGSFFMNPVAPEAIQRQFEAEKGVQSREGRVPAGWLIEKAGLKGYRIGDAMASMQHPNYIVNLGHATAHDVRNVAQMIKLEVAGQFGIDLQEEAALL